ncbi:MAG: hypothetical protein K9J46_09430 [Saprospiraceae bacterium]|nr:hypothetical protein [Saprospiraceae bacterium]
MQVVLVLFILNWSLKKFFSKYDLSDFNWQRVNAEKLVVVLITGGFVVLAVKGGLDSLIYAKDLALVSPGFYFGSLRNR